MESLRWILLAVGIAFVVVIYLLGRSRRQRNHSMIDELEDDLPEFSARSLDDVDEGVGQVRIITRSESETGESDVSSPGVSAEGGRQANSSETGTENVAEDVQEDEHEDDRADKNRVNDIIVLYILPKPDLSLIGSQINSSAQAMGLKFGEMNIFHYMDGNRSVFSLANMLEPGSFDADTIHELKTTGLTVFMQIQGDDPLDDLTEMLQRSYQMAGLLDARLCNHKREPLTEQDAENYRTQVSEFVAASTPELSSET
ncbi:MAG: cell division protein ZipA C-terminal FtsZ-binding domain-containing protein [Proteobacteria bacterium]|nr:cell division protein ZipA C-terminal FtsZ-binding domain-containing protein [Pseudomonadota bacterium]